MYKLLLVDDESEIREGLMEVIHFEEHGFTVVGQAENGLEALRLCEEQEPDLIVSDIRMPLMDGLTMLAEAQKLLPTVRSIILSGYDEFEFARQAVALHCLGYLLKPIFGTSGRFIISSELSLPALHFGLLDHLGTLGAILNDQGALVYLALLMPFVVHIVFYKTRFGLTLRSVGLNEEAARSAGLNVRATQYICLALCGIFCGLAGAQLALSLNMFSVGMTDGRGYTALAVLIMADSRPILSMLACFMFGISDAVVLVLSGTGYNAQILDMLPYVLALLVAVLPLLIRTIARKVKRSRVESSIFNSVQTGETR